MASEIEIHGLDEALRKLNSMGEGMQRLAGEDLYREAEAVMADSKENYVPVVTGALRSTGHVERPQLEGGQISVKLGYGGPAAPYALAVHENPRAGKTGGFSPGAIAALEAAEGVGPRGGLSGGSRRRRFSKVGQWKYLEIPLTQAVGKIRQALERLAAKAFEKG